MCIYIYIYAGNFHSDNDDEPMDSSFFFHINFRTKPHKMLVIFSDLNWVGRRSLVYHFKRQSLKLFYHIYPLVN